MAHLGNEMTEEQLVAILWKRGTTLADRGRHQEALPYLLHYTKRRPDDTEALNKIGSTYAQLDDLDKAEYFFKEALLKDPKKAAAHSNLGNIHFTRGEYDRAIARYKHALTCDPSYYQAQRNMAAALRKQGRFGEAVSALRAADRAMAIARTQTDSDDAPVTKKASGRGCLIVVVLILGVFILYRLVRGW